MYSLRVLVVTADIQKNSSTSASHIRNFTAVAVVFEYRVRTIFVTIFVS